MKKRIACFLMMLLPLTCAVQAQERIEQWKGKTVMVFTPHPDDDLFGCGGTLALLAKNHLARLIEYMRGRATRKDGKYVEAFRRATGFNAQ